MHELSLFSGAGGGLLGSKLLGWTTVGYVEFNEYCQRVLRARIDDGILDNAPIFGDIRAFLDEGYAGAYEGMVDVVTAGFPCQPFSVAGKQAAEGDPRNMWPSTIDVIRKVRPKICFLENVPGLLAGSHGYFGTILRELAESGYDARWRCLSAAEMGAPHRRDRVWILANAIGERCEELHIPEVAARSGFCDWLGYEGNSIDSNGDSITQKNTAIMSCRSEQHPWDCFGGVGGRQVSGFNWEISQSDVCAKNDGVANRVEQLTALGNGQVPAAFAMAFWLLWREFLNERIRRR